MKRTIILITILAIPLGCLAADNYVYNLPFIPDELENILELINLIIAIFGAALAVKLAALSQGGEMEKTWNLLATAAVIFAVLEVYGALNGYNILKISGFGDFVEFIFALVLVYTFYRTRKSLLKKLLGK